MTNKRTKKATRKLFTRYTVEHYHNKYDESPVAVYEFSDRIEAEQEAEVLMAGLERCEGAVDDDEAFLIIDYDRDGQGSPKTVKGWEGFAGYFHEMSRKARVELDNIFAQ